MSMQSLPEEQRHLHKHHIPAFHEVKNRRDKQSNIWFFGSPKNNKRFILRHDIGLAFALLNEGDQQVAGYELNPYDTASNKVIQSTIATVQFKDGRVERHQYCWSKVKTNQSNTSSIRKSEDQSISKLRVARVFTEKDLKGREVEIDNWLHLCAAMNRVRHLSTFRETAAMKEYFHSRPACKFRELYQSEGIDPAIMAGVVARGLQSGLIATDLSNSLFGLDSILSWRASC